MGKLAAPQRLIATVPYLQYVQFVLFVLARASARYHCRGQA